MATIKTPALTVDLNHDGKNSILLELRSLKIKIPLYLIRLKNKLRKREEK